MANKISNKTAKKIQHLGQLYQKKERQLQEIGSKLHRFVFKVLKDNQMMDDINAIKEMTRLVPPSYVRYNLFVELHRLEKQCETNDVSLSGTIDEKIAEEIRHLGQLFREKDREQTEAEENLKQIVFKVMDEQKMWDNMDDIMEMSYRLPSCLTRNELLSRYVELKKQQKADN